MNVVTCVEALVNFFNELESRQAGNFFAIDLYVLNRSVNDILHDARFGDILERAIS